MDKFQNYKPPTEEEIESILNTVMNKMKQSCQLSDEQVLLIRPIQESKLRKRSQMRAEALRTNDMETIMEYKKLVELNSFNADPNVLKLLTSPEQKQLYQEFHEEMKAMNKHGPMHSRQTFLGQELGGNDGEILKHDNDDEKHQTESMNPMEYMQSLMEQGVSQFEAKKQTMQKFRGGMNRGRGRGNRR
jgi:hypothetical protein